MSFQQRTIGEICSELVTEAVRMGYSKRYVWGHMSKYLSIIRGYYRSQHICIFSVEATDACLAFYRIRYAQGTVPDLAICGCGVLLRPTKCSTAA